MINTYQVPETIQEALDMKHAHRSSAYLAGGTEITRLGSSVDAEEVISLKKIGCSDIKEQNGEIRIGALVTLEQLTRSEVIPCYLKKAALFCSSLQRRNRATIGGNIAACRDDSYLLPVLFAAKARLIVAEANGEATIPVREYYAYKEQYASAIILAVLIEKKGRTVLTSRFSKTSSSHAAMTIALGADGKKLSEVRLFAASRGSEIIRLEEAEQAIEQGAKPEEIEHMVVSALQPISDITGSAEYKQYIASVAAADLYKKLLEKGGSAC